MLLFLVYALMTCCWALGQVSLRKEILVSVFFLPGSIKVMVISECNNKVFILFYIYIKLNIELHLCIFFLVLIFMQVFVFLDRNGGELAVLVEKVADPWTYNHQLWFYLQNGAKCCDYSLCRCNFPNNFCLWTDSLQLQVSLFKDDSVDCCEKSSSCPVERPAVEQLHVVTAEEFVLLVKPFGGPLVQTASTPA